MITSLFFSFSLIITITKHKKLYIKNPFNELATRWRIKKKHKVNGIMIIIIMELNEVILLLNRIKVHYIIITNTPSSCKTSFAWANFLTFPTSFIVVCCFVFARSKEIEFSNKWIEALKKTRIQRKNKNLIDSIQLKIFITLADCNLKSW